MKHILHLLALALIFNPASSLADSENRYAVSCVRNGTVVIRIYSDGFRMSEDYRVPAWATAALEACEAIVAEEARTRNSGPTGSEPSEPEAAR